MYVGAVPPTYVRTYMCTYLCILSDDSDDNETDVTPLIKPTSDPYTSTTLMTTGSSSKHGMKWLQHKSMTFYKAFCIPGVVVVSYGHIFDLFVVFVRTLM